MDLKRGQQGNLPSRRGTPNELDLWFEKAVKPHCGSDEMIYRYADDRVCAIRYRDDAERSYLVLQKQLEKFQLEVPPVKTKTLRFSRIRPSMKRRFTFLGFELYWNKERKGIYQDMRRKIYDKTSNI